MSESEVPSAEFALLCLAVLTLTIQCAVVLQLIRGRLLITTLVEVPPVRQPSWPKVSVVIPARNEERHLALALESVLQQDYESLEVIVVDDRSDDGTPAIISRLEKEYPGLKVIRITDLPPGWLGKTHAMNTGAGAATGTYLLFADADVVMQPPALRFAINYMLQNRLDHLVVGPQARPGSFLVNTMLVTFAINFLMVLQPWRAADPRSKKSTGGGAFSLMKTEAYQTIGTMSALRLAVVDDLKLGSLIKAHGFQQEFVAGKGLIAIQWYCTVREMVGGLTKNVFAIFDFSLWKIARAFLGFAALNLWPLLAVFLTDDLTRTLNLILVFLQTGLYVGGARYLRLSPICGLAFPIAQMIHAGILLRSTIVTLKNGGVRWRGTFYSLSELKSS